MTMESQNQKPSFVESRFQMLAKVFTPGINVVARRQGERIIKGKVLRVEGRYAYVLCPYQGREIEDKIRLDRLSELNPELLPRAKSKTRPLE